MGMFRLCNDLQEHLKEKEAEKIFGDIILEGTETRYENTEGTLAEAFEIIAECLGTASEESVADAPIVKDLCLRMHQSIPDGTDYHQVFSAIGILAVTVLAFLRKASDDKDIEQEGVEDIDYDPRH